MTATVQRRSIARPARLCSAILLLASCAPPTPLPAAPRQTVDWSPPPGAGVRLPVARPPYKPPPHDAASNPASRGAQTPPDSAPSPQIVATPPPGPVDSGGPAAAPIAAGQLIGLDQQSAKNLLGASYEVSEQSPAVVWRFHAGDCELDLAFYLDLRSGRMRTLNYEFRGQGADTAKQEACLNAIIAAKREPERS